MVTEEVKTGEVTTEPVAQPEEKDTYTKEEVAVLKGEIEKHKAQLRTERNTITKHTAELKQLKEKGQLSQAQSQELAGLRDSVAGLEDMIATLVDMQAGVTEQPQQYSAKKLLEEKRKAQQGNVVEQPGIDPQVQADALALQRLAVKLGVEGKNLRMARLTYQDEGFDAAWDFMEGLGKDEPKATKGEPKEDLEFPKPPEGSGQSVKHFTRERIANMSPEEYTRHRNEIQEAIDQGRIK